MTRTKASKKPQIVSCVENGTINEVLEIVGRLHFLEEFGMYDQVRRVSELANAVADAEIALAKAKSALRLNAEGLIERVVANWTPEEIEKATGY